MAGLAADVRTQPGCCPPRVLARIEPQHQVQASETWSERDAHRSASSTPQEKAWESFRGHKKPRRPAFFWSIRPDPATRVASRSEKANGLREHPPSPTTLRPGSWSCLVVGAKREETCVCVWWVGGGSEEVGTVSAALFVIGCCSPLLHTGSDKFRLVHLTQSCGHSESV